MSDPAQTRHPLWAGMAERNLLWLRRVVMSLRRKGMLWLADRALSALQERLFDLRYGTDTVTHVPLQSLTIAGPNADEGTPYEPTRLRPFRRLMRTLSLPPGSGFVDFGCGKGRVLLLAAGFGFARITGVEFAKELCDIARKNAALYQRKTGLHTAIRIVEADAAGYEIPADDNFFYMFNPFSATLVKRIIQNIAQSVAKNDRRVFIIYFNPRWRDLLTQQGFVWLLDFDGGEGVVYSNRASA